MIKELSIIIPVYNSEGILENLTEKLIQTLEKKYNDFEIILINDASKDNSWKIVKELCKKNKLVKGINLRKNVGQHNAIFAGLKNCNGKIIVTMDDDGQNLPESIPALVNELNKGFDICYANYKNKKHNFFRKFGSFINNLVASILFDKPYNLVLTGFRCFTNDIKNEILNFNSAYIYLDGVIFSCTSNYSQIYVDHKEREIGKSDYTTSKLISLWLRMAFGFSIMPLRLASIFGILLSFASLVIAVWLIFFRSMSSAIPLGWTSLMVIILFLGGIQLLALGLIGEYLGRTYITINNPTKYSIKNKINF